MSRRGKGEGSIEKLPSGRFRIVVTTGRDPLTGKQRKSSRTFDKQALAVAELRKRENQTRGDWARKPLKDWLENWIEFKRQTVEPASHLWYDQRVRCHLVPRLGEVLLGKLTPILISDMLVKMGRDGSSGGERRRVFRTLQFALNHAVAMDQIGVNPCKMVEPPKADEIVTTCLERDQALALLAAARGGPLEPFITLALDTGMRPGELFGLHWPDLDLLAGVVNVRQSLENVRGKTRLKVPKTKGSRRKVRIAPRTVEVMRRHREAVGGDGAGPVFTSPGGGFVNHANFSNREFK